MTKHLFPKITLLLVTTLLLAACSKPSREFFFIMRVLDTQVELTLHDVDKATAAKAKATVQEDLNTMRFMWHPWKAGPLGRTNELLATGAEFSANPSVLPLIKKARVLSASSDNLYNPAIGKLLDLWGFHTDEQQPKGPPPSAEAIARLVRQNPQISDIVEEGVRMKSLNPAVKLDFDSLSKGVSFDREMAYLQSIGIKNARIKGRHDVKVLGRYQGKPWQIGIPHPRKRGEFAMVNLNDGESLFTASDNERYYKYNGKRYHPILDPRTGYPADKTALVAVIHPEAATADAATTALFVAGPDEWVKIAKQMNLHMVMLIDYRGIIHLTPAMAERIKWQQDVGKVVISEPI